MVYVSEQFPLVIESKLYYSRCCPHSLTVTLSPLSLSFPPFLFSPFLPSSQRHLSFLSFPSLISLFLPSITPLFSSLPSSLPFSLARSVPPPLSLPPFISLLPLHHTRPLHSSITKSCKKILRVYIERLKMDGYCIWHDIANCGLGNCTLGRQNINKIRALLSELEGFLDPLLTGNIVP